MKLPFNISFLKRKISLVEAAPGLEIVPGIEYLVLCLILMWKNVPHILSPTISFLPYFYSPSIPPGSYHVPTLSVQVSYNQFTYPNMKE